MAITKTTLNFKLMLIIVFMANNSVFATSQIITVCKVRKEFNVILNTSLSPHWETKSIYNNDLDSEVYTLSKVTPQNPREDAWLRQTEYLNISYLSKSGLKFNELDLFNEELDDTKRELLNKQEYLTRGNPIIIKTTSLGDYNLERIYFFNIDKKGKGNLTMTFTRWGQKFDIGNGQQSYYAECEGI